MSTEPPKVDCALAYAALGQRVFPCHEMRADRCSCGKVGCKSPAKHPRLKGWQRLATTDEPQIREWWTTWPNGNVGVACGKESDLLVLDVDGEAGLASLCGLLEQGHELSTTPEVASGSGGSHLYFRHAEGLSNAVRFAPGLDIRTEGGFVVGAGSRNAKGEYRFRDGRKPKDVEVQPVPQWLIDLVKEHSTQNGATAKPFSLGTETIAEGERNDTLYRFGRSLRARGFGFEEIEAALRVVNERRCVPPVSPDELAQIARNAATQANRPDFAQPDPEIVRLATVSVREYENTRKKVANRLGMRVTKLDEEVEKAKRGSKRLEHSNQHALSLTGAGPSSGSNSCSIDPKALYEKARELLESSDPMQLVREAICASGYAGDTRPAELAFLSLSSRCQERPLNLHYLALSASGKNFTIDTALRLFPPEAYHEFVASSPRALIYCEESFQNRVVIIGECDSIPAEGPAASAIRSLSNDGLMSYEVVEKNPETGRFETRRIEKKGPTGLITTSVRRLDAQMSTRTLQVLLSDSEDQTRQILVAEAKATSPDGSVPAQADLPKFIAFQRWLAAVGERRIVVPFAGVLARLVPARAVRMRRDFKQLLTVVKTHAFLAQKNRARTRDGAVVATLGDYAAARRLLAALFDAIANDEITPAVRETVEAIEAGQEVSEVDLACRLNLAKSTISYRVRRAIRGGWLQNVETRRSYAARLMRAAPLPQERSALPTVEDLEAAIKADSNPKSSTIPSNEAQSPAAQGLGLGSFEHSNRFPGTPVEGEAGRAEEAEIERLAHADGWTQTKEGEVKV